MILKICAFIICLLNTNLVNCFLPATYIESATSVLNWNYKSNLGEISDTLTHDEILRRGIIQSVVKYFYDQPNGSVLINMSKIDNDYYELRRLYHDYYGKWYCTIDLELLQTTVFGPNVANVDYASETTKMPYAHFDGETFSESNKRIMNLTNLIYSALSSKKYDLARQYAGQVVHTIQDFYAHSNWVEQGNTIINMKIGTTSFDNITVANKTEATCASNCTLITIECSVVFNFLSSVTNLIGIESGLFECPIKYYKCYGNLVLLNKLVSGYSENEKLPDGTPFDKPSGYMKCSHGGIIDTTGLTIDAKGGINKDAGYYIISPHADLHLTAANLAINHTKYYFDSIRSTIGDSEYANFLKLQPDDNIVNILNNYIQFCGTSKLTNKQNSLLLTFITLIYLYIK